MLSTDQKGAIAETAIALDAIKLGIGVLRPVNDGMRYDLAFDLDGRRLVRVQVEWAKCHGEVIVLRCYSNRRSRTCLVRRGYSADEIDAYAAYCPDLEQCYFLPIAEFAQQQIQLRLAPTRNNQKRGVIWASDYEFAAKLGRPGAVAQLGERRDGIAEVRGSNPLGSID